MANMFLLSLKLRHSIPLCVGLQVVFTCKIVRSFLDKSKVIDDYLFGVHVRLNIHNGMA